MGGRPSTAIVGTGFSGLGAAIRLLRAGFTELTVFERADDVGGVWRDGPRAYLGMTVAGFPNFFPMYGPNTNVGSGSVVHMLESQIACIVRAARALRDPEVLYMDIRTSRYLRDGHRNAGNRPGSMLAHRRRTRTLDRSDHRFVVR